MYSGRLTLWGVVKRALGAVTDLDRGLLFTARSLTYRPGDAVRDYIEGRTVRYTNPVKYLLIMVALATFVSIQTDTTNSVVQGFLEGRSSSSAERLAEELAIIQLVMLEYFNVLLVFGIPFMVFWSRVWFRRAGLNTAEHFVFNSYLFAQICLLTVAVLPLTWLGLSPYLRDAVVIGAATILYATASIGFFRTGPVRGSLGALGVLVATAFSYLVAGAVAFGIIVAILELR